MKREAFEELIQGALDALAARGLAVGFDDQREHQSAIRTVSRARSRRSALCSIAAMFEGESAPTKRGVMMPLITCCQGVVIRRATR